MQALFSCFHSRLGGFTPHRMPSTASNLVARWALLAFFLSRSHTSTGQCCTPAPPGLSHDHGQLSGLCILCGQALGCQDGLDALDAQETRGFSLPPSHWVLLHTSTPWSQP